jgi:tetratricopeptide (TPR) repeat protein
MSSRLSTAALAAALALGACAPDPAPPAPPPEPPSIVAHLEQARALFEATRFEEAASVSREGLALDSTAVDLHNILASTYAAQGRYALAIEALNRTVHLQPDYATGYVNLGGVYTKLGQYERAATHLQRAVALNPDNSPVRRRLGELYLATSRYAEATRELLEALRLFPDDATLYYYLGQSLAAEGRDDDAIEVFQRATLLDIGFADAYYRLAALARKEGRDDLARSALERFNRLRRIGDSDPEVPKQVKRMRAAILNAPEEAAHHYNLGLLFVRQGYFAEAQNKFDRAVSLHPGDLDFLNRIGGDLVELKQPEAALRYLQQALAQDPAFFPALLNTGHITGRLGRYAEAVAHFRKVVEIQPSNPEGWYFLGLGLANHGARAEAAQALRRGLDLAVDDALRNKIQRRLADLQQQAP